MAFRFIHNLIEKIKEVYNRPYEEARREKLEHQRKIWEEQGNELKARQESENFIHYCCVCYAYASVLPLNWDGGHMGCGGGIYGFPEISKESFDAMSEEEKAKTKDKILKFDADRCSANLIARLRWQATHTSECPMCQSTNFIKIADPLRSASAVASGASPSSIGKHYKCNSCGFRW